MVDRRIVAVGRTRFAPDAGVNFLAAAGTPYHRWERGNKVLSIVLSKLKLGLSSLRTKPSIETKWAIACLKLSINELEADSRREATYALSKEITYDSLGKLLKVES